MLTIRKIEVKGPGKPVAALEFSKGLNVIAGASNTGKSYVVQCIQYILGSSKIPKAIDESKGYDLIEVTFQQDDNSEFLLRRKLAPNADTLLIEIGTDDVIVLKGKHKQGINNLSNRFLKEFGLNDKYLLKSKDKLTTQALSLRTLEKIFVIDETRIVADYSPLGTGQRSEKTLELSLLRTLLTGVDAVAAKKLRVEAESKTALERKMNTLEELIEKLYPKQSAPDQGTEEIDSEVESLDKQLEESDENIMEVITLGQILIEKGADLVSQITTTEAQQQEELLLIDRFKLLRAKYESDKSRLLGIGEAADTLDSFTRVTCPTCGQTLDGVMLVDEIDDISVSAQAEAQKIDVQLRDLDKAITEIQQSVARSSSDIEKLQEELKQTNSVINGNIKDKIAKINQLKAKMYARQMECKNARQSIESRSRALAELGSLRIQANVTQASYETNSFEEELGIFLGEICTILGRWGYPDYQPTTFSDQDRDIVIGGTPRANYGKGYRAIAFSAFVIGLMVNLSKLCRHPGFVVLDSPLTTYKQADHDRGEANQSIEADMVYAFYRDLCDSFKDRQVIIFDNQEPDNDLKPMMKYEHFSKNKNLGRYGFFPQT